MPESVKKLPLTKSSETFETLSKKRSKSLFLKWLKRFPLAKIMDCLLRKYALGTLISSTLTITSLFGSTFMAQET